MTSVNEWYVIYIRLHKRISSTTSVNVSVLSLVTSLIIATRTCSGHAESKANSCRSWHINHLLQKAKGSQLAKGCSDMTFEVTVAIIAGWHRLLFRCTHCGCLLNLPSGRNGYVSSFLRDSYSACGTHNSMTWEWKTWMIWWSGPQCLCLQQDTAGAEDSRQLGMDKCSVATPEVIARYSHWSTSYCRKLIGIHWVVARMIILLACVSHSDCIPQKQTGPTNQTWATRATHREEVCKE